MYYHNWSTRHVKSKISWWVPFASCLHARFSGNAPCAIDEACPAFFLSHAFWAVTWADLLQRELWHAWHDVANNVLAGRLLRTGQVLPAATWLKRRGRPVPLWHVMFWFLIRNCSTTSLTASLRLYTFRFDSYDKLRSPHRSEFDHIEAMNTFTGYCFFSSEKSEEQVSCFRDSADADRILQLSRLHCKWTQLYLGIPTLQLCRKRILWAPQPLIWLEIIKVTRESSMPLLSNTCSHGSRSSRVLLCNLAFSTFLRYLRHLGTPFSHQVYVIGDYPSQVWWSRNAHWLRCKTTDMDSECHPHDRLNGAQSCRTSSYV